MAAVTGTVIAGAALANQVYSASEGRRAARDAADIQAEAAGESLLEQQRQFDLQQEQLSPYREAGGLALGQQQALLGLRGPEEQALAYSQFSESPAQQFLQEQGLRLIDTSGLGGGERLRELTRFGQGLALQGFDDYYNRLGGIAGTGYSATTGGLGLGAQNIADRAASREMQAAARASGTLGAQQATTQGIEGVFSQLPGLVSGIQGLRTPPPPQQNLAMNAPNPNQFGGIA
jgi:hypothetical protein